MNGIEVGDVVQLKSGGVNMTVSHIEEINGNAIAWCNWTDKGKNRTTTYPVTALKRAE